MNKEEFTNFIAKKHSIKKIEAVKVIDMFTSSVIDVMHEKNDCQSISLIGFGSFSVSSVAARDGRNPKDGSPLKISAYKQPKFKSGQRLKDACNGRK